MISENTAKMVNGSYITIRLEDLLYGQKTDDEEETADEIIDRMRKKMEAMRGD